MLLAPFLALAPLALVRSVAAAVGTLLSLAGKFSFLVADAIVLLLRRGPRAWPPRTKGLCDFAFRACTRSLHRKQ